MRQRSTRFGDGLTTLQSLKTYKTLTTSRLSSRHLAPVPWYANSPPTQLKQQETFIVSQLEPWVTSNLATTHHEQNWLIGYSKSGYGGLDLLLPASPYLCARSLLGFPGRYVELQRVRRLSRFVRDGRQFSNQLPPDPGLGRCLQSSVSSENRLWIGGYDLFGADVNDFNNLLKDEGVAHSTEVPTRMAHRWDSGWVPLAISALYKDSQDLATNVSSDGA